jgi:hypothetical protein
MRSPVPLRLLAVVLTTGCAATEPLPPPPVEVVVTVNRTARTLSLFRTSTPGVVGTITLGATSDLPAGITAREGIALVPLGADDAVAVVDLLTGIVLDQFDLAAGSEATGAAIVDDSVGYVAEPALDRIVQIDYRTGDTASVVVGNHPRALIFTRGRIFVLNANVDGAGDPLGASWLTVIDPVTNTKSTGIDSIPLLGPGNARAATVGPDGLLYVLSAGDSTSGEGRLSIVNPVTREEVGSFGGFGLFPTGIAASGDRLYVSSVAEGVMEFDIREREVIRGVGEGEAIATSAGLAAGANGRIYAASSGPCTGGTSGGIHILRPSDLVEVGSAAVGECGGFPIVTTVPVP